MPKGLSPPNANFRQTFSLLNSCPSETANSVVFSNKAPPKNASSQLLSESYFIDSKSTTPGLQIHLSRIGIFFFHRKILVVWCVPPPLLVVCVYNDWTERMPGHIQRTSCVLGMLPKVLCSLRYQGTGQSCGLRFAELKFQLRFYMIK